MPSNKSDLVTLRNATIWWLWVTIILIGGLWFSYNFFSNLSKELDLHNEKKILTIDNILLEWIISDQTIDDSARDNLRLQTIKQVVPGISEILGIGTPEEQKNLTTLKKITKKEDTAEKDYTIWLQKSWDSESKENLDKVQEAIAEIIPVFSGVSGVSGTENTKHITGKITLKSLIDFIQHDIADKYHLGHAIWSIGIDGVKFDQDNWEIWAYDIPLKFDNVSNKDVIALLDFLSQTGGIKVRKMDNNQLTVEHIAPRFDKRAVTEDKNLSQLRNPLILVNNLSVSPTWKDTTVLIQEDQEWSISVTLTFYIRWVSGDHLMIMDNLLRGSVWSTNTGTLATEAIALLKICGDKNDCTDERKISDIISLLNSARDTYKSILAADKDSTPISRVKRRSELMTTVSSIQKKLEQLQQYHKI